MIVSINQPAYLPWLGYFHRIAISDLHVVLDHVQFEKNSFTNRNKVRTKDGWCWLTVPVSTKGQFGNLSISDLMVVNQLPWQAKHWATLRMNYAKSPFFHLYADFFEDIYTQKWDKLNDLLNRINLYILAAFNIETPILYSSRMAVDGNKDELVRNICVATGATTYLSGPFGRDYLRPELFTSSGIDIVYHDYLHPTYAQLYPDFQPYLTVLDLLFNHGPNSRQILMSLQKEVVIE